MFTGIVQKVSKVLSLEPSSSESFKLTISQPFSMSDPIHLGESIANNGVCLTVTDFDPNQIRFDLAPETLRCTSLGRLKAGSLVNLERSLRMGDRLSGHWVQGHVDGVARVIDLNRVVSETEYYDLGIEFQNSDLLKYCVKKGSISLDGISLTIHDIRQNHLFFQIIPHTWSHTALPDIKVGDLVNIEVDILAKYAENFSTFQRVNSTSESGD